MAFHRFHQRGNSWLETLAADAVGSFPWNRQRLDDGLIVEPGSQARRGARLGLLSQHPNRVLTVELSPA